MVTPRLAVVSGGGTGIGKAVAAALAADGDEVVLVGRRPEPLRAAAEEINGDVGDKLVRWHAADLSRPGEARGAASAVLAGGDRVDVIVNNAGGTFGPSGAADLEAVAEAWRRDLEGNVLTAVLLTGALLPNLARPGGRIVSLGSVAALRGGGSYGGVKAALHAWTYSLATALVADGATANVVAPGYVGGTEFFGERMSDALDAALTGQIPARRSATPAEIAAAVRHLASPEAGYTTGQVLQVNGGWVLGRG